MNKTFEEDDKVIIIREYNEAENPYCFNDMLEFLYAMKNELQTKLDVIRNYYRCEKLGGWNPASLENIRVSGDIVGSVYEMRVSTENLNLVNQMIEHVLASDKKMFAIVFDKVFSAGRKWNNILAKPRIIDIEKTSIDTLSEIDDENHELIFNVLDNNTMMLQGARNYDHCRIQDIKEENIMIKKIHEISKRTAICNDYVTIRDARTKYGIDSQYGVCDTIPIKYYFYYHACISSIASPNIITSSNGEVNVVMHIERSMYSRRTDVQKQSAGGNFEKRSTKCFEYICDEHDLELLNKDIEGFFENKMNEEEENK